jgi:hypothetical protein
MSLAHGQSWDQFAERLRELETLLSQSRARTIRGARIRETARGLAQQFFREVRPHLVAIGVQEAEIARLDAPVRGFLEISHRHAERSIYVRRVAEVRQSFADIAPLREMHIGRAGSVGVAVLTPVEEQIVQTLESLNPTAAQAYLQATIDLSGPPRHSYRGVAHELREAIRETLDHFAPDADVMAEPGFELDPGQTRPTQRQKAVFVLRRRRLTAGARRAPEEAVTMVEELGAAIARSTYTRGSISAHGSATATEVRQLKMYVDAVLAELLEIHGQA